MKKILCFVICVLMIFLLTACFEGEPSKEVNTGSQGSSQNESSGNEKFYLNETAVFDNLKITATKIEESSGKNYFEPKEGNVFVGVNFTIENISSEVQTISSLLLFEAYADDIKCDYSISAVCAFDNSTLDGDLAAGRKMVGWYAVEVPKEWKGIEFEVKSSWLSNSSATFVFEK